MGRKASADVPGVPGKGGVNYRAPDGLVHLRGPDDEEVEPLSMYAVRTTRCEHFIAVRWDGDDFVPTVSVPTCIQCLGLRGTR